MATESRVGLPALGRPLQICIHVHCIITIIHVHVYCTYPLYCTYMYIVYWTCYTVFVILRTCILLLKCQSVSFIVSEISRLLNHHWLRKEIVCPANWSVRSVSLYSSTLYIYTVCINEYCTCIEMKSDKDAWVKLKTKCETYR